ncbi:uncharacterized protein [Argopecten irradians]|uniref:uncharacterized protein n=1 Tax=Argopecten irradians TaxID=31199 RepID=UPI00371EAAF3
MFTYMVALNTNAINFNPKHRGKIIGILNAFFAGSPSVFSALYFHVIGKDNPKSVDSFSTLMLVFAVSFVVIDILCIGFLHVFPNEEQLGKIFPDVTEKNSEASGVQAHNNGFTEDSNTTDAVATSDNTLKYVTDSTNTIVNAEPDDVSMIKILLNVDYQLLTWVITSASVAGLVFTIALTQTTSAIGLASHNADIVLIIPITNGVISAAVGIISDYFKQRLPRLGIFVAGNFTFVICQCLVVGLADEYPVLVIATVFNGIGQGILWSIAPTVMSEIFSIKNLGRNWGIALLVSSLVGFAAQEAFGALYDAGISVPGEVYCYGMSCVRGGHAVTLGITAMSMVLGVILYIRRRRG